jgi:hypothetical protein
MNKFRSDSIIESLHNHKIQESIQEAAKRSGKSSPLTDQVKADPNYIGDKAVEKQLNDQIAYRLGSGESYASADSWEITELPKGSKKATVKVEGHTSVSIPLGDGEYERDTEYWTRTYKVTVFK